MAENIDEIAALVATVSDTRGMPASGTVAGVVASMAASLLALVADRSRPDWPEAPGATAQAQALGRRALVLAERLADAYDAARLALEAVGQPGGDAPGRDLELGRLVAAAAEPPLALGACAADIAVLAAAVAVHGAPDLRANAVVAAKLAAAVADGAAHLVEINLVAGADQEKLGLARMQARTASEAARSAAAA
jgi:hypothetical protein